jgi:hypothetical protein
MFVALVVVRAVAVARRNINLSRLQADYVEMIRSSLARRLAAAPWPVVSRLQHARVTHLMSGDINRIGAATHYMVQFAAALVLITVRSQQARLCSRWACAHRSIRKPTAAPIAIKKSATIASQIVIAFVLAPALTAPLRKRQSHRR